MELAQGKATVVPEEGLVRRAQSGDGDAFAQLYESYSGRVYRYFALRLGNPAEAEDLTGDVFLRAWESLPRFQWRGVPFSAWLFRIARNRLTDHFRQQKGRKAIPLEEAMAPDDPAGLAEQRLRLAEVAQGLKRLTEAQRQVLALRLGAGLSVAETARALGKTEGAIKALTHAALAALRRHLGGDS